MVSLAKLHGRRVPPLMTRRRVKTIPTSSQRHRPTLLVYQEKAVGKCGITSLECHASMTE